MNFKGKNMKNYSYKSDSGLEQTTHIQNSVYFPWKLKRPKYDSASAQRYAVNDSLLKWCWQFLARFFKHKTGNAHIIFA